MFEVLLIDMGLLGLVAILAVAIVQVRSLLCAVILGGIYSLLMALVWHNMEAVDVAFTEAAVGAGISTVLLLGTLLHVERDTKQEPSIHWPALGVVTLTGAFLIFGTLDMPEFGDPKAPIHTGRVVQNLGQRVGKVDRAGNHLAWEYTSLEEQAAGLPDDAHPWEQYYVDTYGASLTTPDNRGHPVDDFMGHSPNAVTSLLASYRGYDTMYETAVIFTAGITLIILLRRRREDVV